MPVLKQMDLDAFAAARWPEWKRLSELARSRSLSGAESDELVTRYQAGATDLSDLRTTFGETNETDRLSVDLSAARRRLTGTGANTLAVMLRFFGRQLPASLYRIRWWTLGAAGFTIVVAALTYAWVLQTPGLLAQMGTEAQLQQYAEDDFVNYYSEFSETSFGARVFTNNAWIAAQCIAFGVSGLWVPMVLLQNAVGLGQAAAVLAAFDHLDTFFLWIAPHGLLELTMIFVAAAAGFRIFWAWVVPGARTRLQALAEEGRRLFVVAIGTTIFLFVSGFIEGFVTRQDWPWAVKIGIGVIAFGLFCAYAYWLGRRAWLAGETGDLVRFEAGSTRIAVD